MHLARFTETAEFQPIFIDFLASIVERCLAGGVALSAQKNKLEGKLFIRDESNIETEKEVNGHTDVLVVRREESAADWTDSDTLKFHVELKSPFGALYQRSANAAKDQVVIETEIIVKMLAAEGSGRCRRVFGALTDLFAIAIVVREAQGDDESHHQPITYISRRRVDPRGFLLRLLLLFCDLEDVTWRDLLSRSMTLIDTAAAEDDDAEAGEGGEGIANPSQDGVAADENVAASGRARLTRSVVKHSHFYTSKGQAQCEYEDEDEDEDKEGRVEAIKKLFQWEASRLGLAYLSASELNSRNSAMPRFQHKEFPLL
jgi:hypothetical protein